MFSKILIANRGEIACRIAATAGRMGIHTVAVYSEADTNAKHVAACDQAFAIGPAAAKDSYLRGDKIIAAALATGAQAIHPGYGFLSENADFADACTQEGLIFIGPPASAIRAMGSKSAAKSLMEKAGVPLVPGYHGERQDPEFLQAEADRIGYPVLLKASAGGGGKGMRVVEKSTDFKEALASCKREAINAFGNDQVLIEKYLQRPRHIEIQVFADTHGNAVYLFERDCSVQRRHQKVLEEAPAPGMTPERRTAMGNAAVAAAKAVGYVGAGTVEFIANQDGSFYFMEMNTRLQVEHPVTEMITGTDLVEWQLRVAAGEVLPAQQSDLQIQGHAIEARIYAENPEKGFLPSIGYLQHLQSPAGVAFELGTTGKARVRIDGGVRQGDTISPYYDPMIAKLIVWGKDRQEALVQMAQALAQYQIVGVASNVAFLQRLIDSDAFAQADLDTGLIERHHDALFPLPTVLVEEWLLASVALLSAEHTPSSDPWQSHQAWCLNSQAKRRLTLTHEGQAKDIAITYQGDQWLVDIDQHQTVIRLLHADQHQLRIALDQQVIEGTVVHDADVLHIFYQGRHIEMQYQDALAHAGQMEVEAGQLTAPMPGKIIAIMIKPGQMVQRGTSLIVMEAMKMEHTVTAPSDGVVKEVLYAVGEQVAEGATLLAFEVE